MNKTVLILSVALALGTIGINAQTATAPKTPSGKTSAEKGLLAELSQKSKENWEAYKTGNVDRIKAVTAEDYVSYSLEGPSDLAGDIASVASKKLKVESYSVDDPKLSMVTKDVAILRYKCNLKGTIDKLSLKPVNVTEVWVNRNGKWLVVSYSETPFH